MFLWDYVPVAGDVVIDVGAGLGFEAVLFSASVGTEGRVIAIEAHPRICQLLWENVTANGLGNVEVVNAAAMAIAGDVALTDDVGDYIGNTVIQASRPGIVVPAVTLDALAESRGLKNVGLLKMNIEGAEVEALRGASKVLEAARNVCISCHDFLADVTGNDAFRTKSTVVSLLEEAGFKLRFRDDRRDYVRDYVYGTK